MPQPRRARTSTAYGCTASRFFYDCEFIEDGRTIELVSIGVVDEDGREFYAVSTEFDPERAGQWVRRNVLDKLPPPAGPGVAEPGARSATSCSSSSARTASSVELWAWFAAYDHVALAQLWGAMPELPRRAAPVHP